MPAKIQTVSGILQRRGDGHFIKILEPVDHLHPGALLPWKGEVAGLKGITKFYYHEGELLPIDAPTIQSAASQIRLQQKVETVSRPESFAPLAWQQRALTEWKRAGCHGIVEAVTGSGKTFLAIAAWRHAMTIGRPCYALVVVPSITLQEQWRERISQCFPGTRVALLGGGRQDSFAQGSICIAVVNSVVSVGQPAEEARIRQLFDHCRNDRNARTLLVADECHHYVHAPIFSRIRTLQRYSFVLALSATVGENYHIEGFGRIVFSYTFQDAVREGLVPRFLLVNTPCRLRPKEQETYAELSTKIGDQFETVKELFEETLSMVPEDQIFRELKRLDTEAGPNGQPEIRRLLGLIFRRSSLIYEAADKLAAAEELIELLVNDRRSKVLVFFERIDSADQTHERLDIAVAQNMEQETRRRIHGWSGVLHSGMNAKERARTLSEFKGSGPGVLFTCRVLDEGLDVPEIDAAILVSSTKSPRQRIQRIGRVLRRGDGNKKPVVVTLYCEGTTDQSVTSSDATIFGEAAEIKSLRLPQLLASLKRVPGPSD